MGGSLVAFMFGKFYNMNLYGSIPKTTEINAVEEALCNGAWTSF